MQVVVASFTRYFKQKTLFLDFLISANGNEAKRGEAALKIIINKYKVKIKQNNSRNRTKEIRQPENANKTRKALTRP